MSTAITKKKAGHLRQQVPAVVPTVEEKNVTTVQPDLKTAMEELGIKVVEVEDLELRACWVRSVSVLMVRPGTPADDETIAWAKEQAAQDRFPRPKDAPLPEWANSVCPGPNREPDGWEWQPNDSLWSRAPLLTLKGAGWEVSIEGRQTAPAPTVIEDENKFGVNVECGWEKWTPARMRKFATAMAKMADEFERLKAEVALG